jgi:ribokinase
MILVAGSANLDFVVRAPHIPAPGETVLGREFKTFPGGKGANQAVACARSGAVPTQLLAALGNDAYSAPIESSMQDAGVQLRAVRVQSQPTGTAFICVSDDAENAITVAPGANECLRPGHLPSLHEVTHLLMQLETPIETVVAYARAAKAQGVQVVLNAAPARPLPQELMALLDVLVVNEGELATVSGISGSVAECLASLSVPTLVVTLGNRGCCARAEGQVFMQPAFKIDPVDTTAAGDTFCGTLVAELSRGSDLQRALQIAGAAGALACTRPGAQSSIPTATAVAQFLALQPGPDAQTLSSLSQFCGFARAHIT